MVLDIAFGFILTFLVGFVTGIEPTWTFLLIGLVGSLWPDIDFAIWMLRDKKIGHLAHQHRDLLHNPCFNFPLLTIFIWQGLGWQYGILFLLSTLAHFIHDTIGEGWGVRWLYPMDNRYLCYRSVGGKPAKLYLWTRAEQHALAEKYGDPNWLKKKYGTLNFMLVTELIALVLCIVPVAIWFNR